MNNRKESFRKIAAFVSALSLLAAVNYPIAESIAVEMSMEQINEAEDDDPAVTTDETDTSEPETSATEPTPDPEATKEERQLKFPEGSPLDNNEKRDIFNTINECINNTEGLGGSVTVNYYEDTDTIELKYDVTDDNDEISGKLEDFFSQVTTFEASDRYYKFSISADTDGYVIDAEAFHPLTVAEDCSWLSEINIELENGYFVKKGTVLNEESIIPKNGYCFNAPLNYNMNGRVTIQNDGVHLPDGYTGISKTRVKLTFDCRKVDIEFKKKEDTVDFTNTDNKEITLDWLDLKNIEITLSPQNGGVKDSVMVNGSVLNSLKNITLEDFIDKIGLDVPENADSENKISVSSIPEIVSGETVYEDISGNSVTENVEYHIKDDKVQLPYVLNRDGEIYYLEKYELSYYDEKFHFYFDDPDHKRGEFELSQILEAIENGDIYSKDISATYALAWGYYWFSGSARVKVYYKQIKESDNIELDKEILENESSANAIYRKNPNVIGMKKLPSFSIGFENFEDDEIFMIEALSDDKLESGLHTVKNGRINFTEYDPDHSSFYRFKAAFRNVTVDGNTVTETINIGDPVILYLDRSSPEINSSDKYSKNQGWSNDKTEDGFGMFEFTLNITDDEKGIASEDEDVQECINKINEDKDLESIRTITIGELVVKKPVNGWRSKKLIEAEKTGVPYKVNVYPENDDNGKVQFRVELILSDPDMKGFDQTIKVMADDLCSDPAEIEIPVKIDTAAPELIGIETDLLRDGMGKNQIINAGADLGLSLQYKAEAEDGVYPSSRIQSIEYSYGDIKEKLPEAPGRELDQSSSEVVMKTAGKNISGKIRIKLTDIAGNSSVYYYSKDAADNIGDADHATTVITDNAAPEKCVMTPAEDTRNRKYHDDSGRDWYSSYPDIYIKASDSVKDGNKTLVPSGIQNLKFKIKNGTNAGDHFYTEVDILDVFRENTRCTDAEISSILAMDTNGLYLHFEPDEDNAQKYIPFLCYSGSKGGFELALSEEPLSLDNEGRLNVQMYSVDMAGNPVYKNAQEEKKLYENGEITLHIDNNAPTVKGSFEANKMNFTAFGAYANQRTEIIVPLGDGREASSGYASSGYDRAELVFAGKTYKAYADGQDPETGCRIEDDNAIFTIPSEELKENEVITGKFTVTVYDKVGNSSKLTGDGGTLLSYPGQKDKNAEIMIENKAPSITETEIKGNNRFVDQDGKAWYNGDVELEYQAADADSGIANVTVKRKIRGAEDPQPEFTDYSSGSEKIGSVTFGLNTKTEDNTDGEFDFEIIVNDNAGNPETKHTTIYKDTEAPYISGFSFTNGQSAEPIEVTGDRFGHFFQNDTRISVTARDDRGASSGIGMIYCKLINSDGSVYAEYSHEFKERAYDGAYTADFDVKEGFKGDIIAWAVDNVSNESAKRNPDGVVSENPERHQNTAEISIRLPETDRRDVDGLPLYKNNVTADIAVRDSFSGIQRIEWRTSDSDENHWITIDRYGNAEGDTEGWSIDENQRNLVLRMSGQMTVSRDANGGYIWMKITDNSGNESEKRVDLSIDKQPPVISVSGIEPSQEKRYYNTDKTVDISIEERNFTAPEINGAEEDGFEADPASPGNTDQFRHTKRKVYNTDGTYRLDIECRDLAGNDGQGFHSGEFVIDKTDPVLSVAFKDSSGAPLTLGGGINYVNTGFSADVTVNEQNFSAGNISIVINGTAYSPSAWTSGTNHTATIPASVFAEDGEYTVAISGKDLAGNIMKSYSVRIVKDTQKPEIGVSGIKSANRGEVVPIIKIKDSNLLSRSVRLFRNGSECSVNIDDATDTVRFTVGNKIYVSGSWILSDDGTVAFYMDNFPVKEECDGVYRLVVETKDRSGNTTTKKEEFSVNRYGSVFRVEGGEDINGKYLSAAPTIVIKEINVDLHDENFTPTVIIDRGSSTVQLDESQFSVSEPDRLEDNSGYEYTYTIPAENFESDLSYKIAIRSVDAAQNENVSTVRGGDLGFTVDTHDPEFSCDGLVDNAQFKESGKMFRINANEALRHIKVSTSDGMTLIDEDAEERRSFTFEIPASNSSRSITVELEDLAGRKTTATIKNLLVTENIVLFVFHRTWTKIAGASALALGAGAAVISLLRKRKRDF